MKITLTQYGGLAAGIRRPPKFVDTRALPPDSERELMSLIAAANTTSRSAAAGSDRARDAMSYKITVDDGAHSIVISQTDATMSGAFAELLGWIQKHASKP